MSLVKICARCKECLSIDLFGERANRKDGHYPYCKRCQRLYQKEWRKSNPESYASSQKKSAQKLKKSGYAAMYYCNNKEKIKQDAREYHAKNLERDNARERERYRANPKRYYDRSRAWIAANPEKAKEYQKRYREKETTKEYQKCYRESHREEHNQRENRRRQGADRSMEKLARRSLENSKEFNFTKADWEEVVELFDYKCAYCRADKKLTRDHFLPLTYPGAGTTRGNIVPACLSCNSSKCSRVPCEWVVEKFGVERYYEVRDIVNYLNFGTERGYLRA